MNADATLVHGLPVDVELEKLVLAAVVMNATDNLRVAVELLRPDDFSTSQNRLLFEQIIRMAESGESIDKVTLMRAFMGNGRLNEVGGMTYITELDNGLPVVYHLDAYCEVLAKKSVLRRAILAAHNGISRLCEPGATLEDLEAFKADLGGIEDESKKRRGGFRHITEIIHDEETGGATEFFNPRIENIGVPWPWQGVNEMVGYLAPGQVVCVSAGTGVGKTTLATQTALWAVSMNHPTGLVTLEMTASEQAKKIIAQHGQACLADWLRGNLDTPSRRRVMASTKTVSETPIFFDDRDDVTPAILRTSLERAKVPLSLVIIDYAQLMDSGIRDKGANREQHVAHISRSIKKLAKRFKCAFIVLSQLNEEGKTRESRALEHDATFHLKLERKPQGIYHLSAIKARFAAFGRHIVMRLDGETGLFTEVETE